jgi:hypothetical protein
VQTFKQGNREAARQLMRQVLLEDSRYIPAWLWMSALVDDVNQQRECLQRVLTIDPMNEPARRGLELLRLQESAAAMSSAATQSGAEPVDHGPGRARKLGEYLIERGTITRVQLEQALHEQQNLKKSLQGARIPLGDVLIKLGMLTPEMLASVLVEQQKDKIETSEGTPPEYLGEYLISKEVITPGQLAGVLAEQTRMRQSGQKMLLGDLLVRAGYITPGALNDILKQQRDDVFRRFGFEE